MTTPTPTPVQPDRPPADPAWRRLTWPATLTLHLAPAAVTFAAALMLAPLVARLGLPRPFALSVAFALVLTPVELGMLLHAAHRVTGRWSLRAVPAVLANRQRLGGWARLVPVLFVIALLIAIGWSPVGDHLGGLLRGIYPAWLLPGSDSTAGLPTRVIVTTSLITLLVDGIVSPTVEELYFRAYLLPRLPAAGWRAVALSAALFALQHYWQPYNWLLIFVLQAILTTLVVRSRSIRLGIVMHCLTNSFGIVLTLLSVVR
jgi:CAAX protease family protein